MRAHPKPKPKPAPCRLYQPAPAAAPAGSPSPPATSSPDIQAVVQQTVTKALVPIEARLTGQEAVVSDIRTAQLEASRNFAAIMAKLDGRAASGSKRGPTCPPVTGGMDD